MTEPAGARERHADLVERITRANRRYYEDDAPELADSEYDALFRELVELEELRPGAGDAGIAHAPRRGPPIDGLQ